LEYPSYAVQCLTDKYLCWLTTSIAALLGFENGIFTLPAAPCTKETGPSRPPSSMNEDHRMPVHVGCIFKPRGGVQSNKRAYFVKPPLSQLPDDGTEDSIQLSRVLQLFDISLSEWKASYHDDRSKVHVSTPPRFDLH
jgi:hypothetical protein